MACGRPVVATDVGGTREILHERNGILIPPRDAGALTKALRDALDRDWDHAGIAAAMSRTWDDVAVENAEGLRAGGRRPHRPARGLSRSAARPVARVLAQSSGCVCGVVLKARRS